MHVVSLWRYPVKSMQGEELDTTDLGELGIHGDRQWALVDLATGLALTARRVPELLYARARLVGDDEVDIELPDGTRSSDSGVLSAWLGREVELRHAGTGIAGRYEIATDFEDEAGSPWVQWDGGEGTFHDSGRVRVSMLGTASIGAWPRRRFRGNVLVETTAVDEEQDLIGRRIGLGSAVLDAVGRIERCVMTTRPQPGGIERDLDVLRTINAQRQACLGVGALVVRSGEVAVGDRLTSGSARSSAAPLASELAASASLRRSPTVPLGLGSQLSCSPRLRARRLRFAPALAHRPTRARLAAELLPSPPSSPPPLRSGARPPSHSGSARS